MDKQLPQPAPQDVVTECGFSAERVIEYQWPPDRTGEFYLLRHQVCQFLETEDLEKKYPGRCGVKDCSQCLNATVIEDLFK